MKGRRQIKRAAAAIKPELRVACGAVGEEHVLGGEGGAERVVVGDAQGSRSDRDIAGEAVVATEHDGPCADGTINRDAAAATDVIGHEQGAGAVKAQCGVVDDGTGWQRAGGSVVADLQRAAVDGGDAVVSAGAGECELAGAGLDEVRVAADVPTEEESGRSRAGEGGAVFHRHGCADIPGQTCAVGGGEIDHGIEQ